MRNKIDILKILDEIIKEKPELKYENAINILKIQLFTCEQDATRIINTLFSFSISLISSNRYLMNKCITLMEKDTHEK